MNTLRTGIGSDSHPLVTDESGTVVLGGVVVAHGKRVVADSDGDVVIHAVCNALSTAIGGGSLDTWAGPMVQAGVRDSAKFLEVIVDRVQQQGLSVVNTAIMIEAAWPRLESRREEMQQSIAKYLHVETAQIGIACTSGEKLTAFGRGEGIYVTATVLVGK